MRVQEDNEVIKEDVRIKIIVWYKFTLFNKMNGLELEPGFLDHFFFKTYPNKIREMIRNDTLANL